MFAVALGACIKMLLAKITGIIYIRLYCSHSRCAN